MTKRKKGFTLIELLVVIAIIGILASVVLASLNSARKKSRDARRVADIKQIQLALELYFDSKSTYPDVTSKLAPTYIAAVPADPLDRAYAYNAYTSSTIAATEDCDEATETCTYYHLGATLEETSNPALKNDRDFDAGDVVDGISALSSDTASCTADTGATVETDLCYDVTP
jgi:prepilin-type N-terminal cleavage/methylation domain-containing protein